MPTNSCKQLSALPRAEDAPRAQQQEQQLQLLDPKTLSMQALTLKAAVLVAESSLGPAVSTQVVKHTSGGILKILRQQVYPEEPRLSCIADAPVLSGPDCTVVASANAAERVAAALDALGGYFSTADGAAAMSKPRPTVMDYHNSYKAGGVTPSAVAERIIAFLELQNDQQHWLSAWSAQHIREAAAAATERYAAGKPLSVLDGVPFAVKDNIDALPYETNYGTRFMSQSKQPVKADAPGVAALKELGSMLIGKTNMNEFGCLATGYNMHLGNPRNPHNPNKATGGSSSGSAAVVAAGVCPFALGTDGGGSIRIPSSLCGIMGLKTTKGRLADDHAAHGCFSSVTVTGPIATTAADLMLVYAALANVDYPHSPSRPARTLTSSSSGRKPNKGADAAVAAAAAFEAPPLQPLELPRVLLPGLQQAGRRAASWKPLAGLSVGIYREWYTMCDTGVLACVDSAAESLLKLGATLVDIQIPELDLLQVAHSAVFAAEYYYDAGQAGWRQNKQLRKQLNLDSRMFYSNGSVFTNADYTAALRIRKRAEVHFERAFKQCDIIITPATPTTAETFPAAAHTSGVYDIAKTFEQIRFTQAASLIGLPAMVLPAGRVQDIGMPVGIQLIGPPYAEATLLRAAAALEQRVPTIVPPLTVSSALPLKHAGRGAVRLDVSTPGRDQQLEAPLKGSVRLQAPANAQRTTQQQEKQLPRLVRLFKRSAAGAGKVAEQQLAAKRLHPL